MFRAPMPMTTITPHCESCGRENPVTDDGYTACCNELVCYGDVERWTDGTVTIAACCGHQAEGKFAAAGRARQSFWRAI